MPRKTALVTNVLAFGGPPSVHALWGEGYQVIAQDAAFTDADAQAAYAQEFPGVIPCGLTDPAELVRHVWSTCERVDVLVSNDAFPAIHGPIEQAKIEDLRTTLEHLLLFPFVLLKEAIPHVKRQPKANVIMITSCRTELPVPGGAIPDIARAGVNALVTSLSIELAPFGIPVNAIAPNYLYSEAYFPRAKFIDNPIGRDFVQTVVPAGRLGKPEEFGELVSYLANMKGSFHTGTIIKFAGGWPVAPTWPL